MVSHLFYYNSLCWQSYGSLSCCMSLGSAEGLRYHGPPRPSNPNAIALLSPKRSQA